MKRVSAVLVLGFLITTATIAQLPARPIQTAPSPTKQEAKDAKAAVKRQNETDVANREALAAEYQNKLVDDGSLGDAVVTTSGPNHTRLMINSSVFFTEVFFHELNPQIATTFARAIKAGFTQVTFADPTANHLLGLWRCNGGGSSCVRTWHF